jgi:hypothetical protein
MTLLTRLKIRYDTARHTFKRYVKILILWHHAFQLTFHQGNRFVVTLRASHRGDETLATIFENFHLIPLYVKKPYQSIYSDMAFFNTNYTIYATSVYP